MMNARFCPLCRILFCNLDGGEFCHKCGMQSVELTEQLRRDLNTFYGRPVEVKLPSYKEAWAVHYDGADPPPPSLRAQWKGTDICADFLCECGARAHVDDGFVYAIECGVCHRRYLLDHRIALIPFGEVGDPEADDEPIAPKLLERKEGDDSPNPIITIDTDEPIL